MLLVVDRLTSWVRAGLALLLVLPALAHAADPQLASLVDDPDPVPAGGLYTYNLVLDNNAADAALNTRLRVTVPSGATFVSAAPASANCAPVSATVVECNIGTLGGLGADTRAVSFTWRALGPGPATINATAEVLSSNDVNPANNVQNATTTVISGANMSMAKSGTPNPVVGGANVTYTLSATNAGPNAGGAIVLTDNLPPSVSFVSADGTGWTCIHNAGVVTCNRPGPLAVGATTPNVTIVGRVNASGGTVTNSASIAPATVGGIADPDTSNNTATVNTTVLPGADIRMAQKRVTTTLPAIAGTEVTFVLEPRNGGPAAATDVVVTDTVPAGWTLISADGGLNFSCGTAGATATCTRASMPAGATDNITIVARAPDNAAVGNGQTYTNTGSISASTTDPNPGNNSASVNVPVLPDGADLRLAKSKSPNPVALGSNMTSTIVVTNNGPRVATGPLRVIEQLTGETYISSTGTGWVCTPAGSTVVCDHPNTAPGLAVGASLPSLSIVTRADVAGTVSNAACTGSSIPAGAVGAPASPPTQGDPNSSNDCAGVSASATTVRPDLAITKTTSTPTGGDKLVSATESSVTYTLVVSNLSPTPEAATGIRVTDTVPGYISGRSSITSPVVATASGGSTAVLTCAVSGATVTCNQTGGALLPGETVTIPITVNRALQEGSYTNTATVSNTVEGDPNSSNNSASDTVTIDPIADVEMTGKTVTPNPLRAGENATYVLSFRNNGPSPALSVVVSDSFSFPVGDSGATVVSINSSKAGSTCSIAAGAVLNPASPSFNCNIGTLANGETQTITLVVRPNFQTGNGARVFDNTANVTTSTPESPSGGDNGNNSRNASLNVTASAIDLLTNKTDFRDPVPYTAGATFIGYRVRVTSNGPSYGTNVRINETMAPPAGRRIRFVCDTTTFGGSTCNAVSLCTATGIESPAPGAPVPAFSCQVPSGNSTTGLGVGELASGASKDIFLRFQVLDDPAPTGDIFNNVATVSSNEPDSFPSNNSESEGTTVRQRVDLRVTKAASINPVALRQPFVWTVTVRNLGPGTSLQTDLTDTLPAGTEVTGPITWSKDEPAGSGSCTRAGLTVSCALGALSGTPAGTATISIPVRVVSFPSAGTSTNSATVDTDPNKTGGIDTPGGNNTGTAPVTVTRSSLQGLVFEDRDRSGAAGGVPQASGTEPRIQGVTITLTGTDAYGNTVSLSTVTDANGSYRFDNLSPAGPGGYVVTQSQPAGFVNGPVAPPDSGPNAPSVGGTYAGGGSAGNSSYTVNLGAADTAQNYNFPEVRRPTLSGIVYVDADASGVRTPASDPAIPGATVRLLDANTLAVVATTTTGADGSYSFTSLDPLRTYTLEQPLPGSPANLRNGPVNPGTINSAACASGCTAQPNTPAAGTDRIAAIDLSVGIDGLQFNFGETQITSISGLVFVDANANNALDAGDAQRLAGVTMRLVQGADCTSGTTLQTVTTQADGSYRFDNVTAFANYLVCQTQPTGYGTGSANGVAGSNSIAISNLAPAGSANNNFGETLGSLSGSVYVDVTPGNVSLTNNGQKDPGEPGLAGVPVTLTGTDINGNAVNLSTVTDAAGDYRFDGLLQGSYTVIQGALPLALGSFLDGRETAGSAGGSTAVNDRIGPVALGAGAVGTGYLFGEISVAPISGTVFIDRDRDGQLDPVPTDGRLPGVSLSVFAGNTCTGSPLATVQTDANGNYAFSGLTAGQNYSICPTQPVGYGAGAVVPGAGGSVSGSAILITNLPVGGSAGNHFGQLTSSLAGAVYADFTSGNPALSDNGVRNAGEAGIAGVTITLSGTDAQGNAVNRSTVTDANGDWRFDDLLGGSYTVSEGAVPSAAGSFIDGRETAGSSGGSTAVNDSIGPITLANNTQATGYLFGELPSAEISGTVYVDRNRNNSLEPVPTDAALPGVTLRLVQGADCSSGTTLQSTTTDAAGSYRFSGIAVGGNYLVCQTQPSGYANGVENPGGGGAAAGANAIRISNLPASGSSGNNFGERLGSVSGSVFLDANNDGVVQSGDSGLAGVTFTLTGVDVNGNVVNRSTTSDANGNWRFDDLLASGPGGYTVTQQAAQPVASGVSTLNGRTTAGTLGGSAAAVSAVPSAVAGINLGAGADSNSNLFAEILPVGLSGTVFADANNNGLQDGADAGIPGQTLVLTGVDDTGAPVTRNLVTNANGRYSVADLRPGTYTLTQPDQPPGTMNGQTLPGSAGGTASAVPTTPSVIGAIVLTTPGTQATAYNFAEIPNNASLTGRVWLDNNNNAQIDGSETGIAGVTIELSGTSGTGATVTRSTVTDSSGNWRFDSLPPGNYSVTQPNQPTGTLAGSTVAGSTGGTASAVATSPSTISAIPLAAGQSSVNHLFGEIPPAEISGRVYGDLNNNGLVDTGEAGIGGVTIRLTGTDDLGNAVSIEISTNADGTYSFPNLRPGTYTVTEPTQPADTVNGITSAGSAGGSASAVGTTPSAISNIALAPGVRSQNNNFAELTNSPDLRVSKVHSPERFTATLNGRYTISVRNVGQIATSGDYTVQDRLPPGLSLLAARGSGGWACEGAVGSSQVSCRSSRVLASGQTSPDTITVEVLVAAAAALASPANNAVLVEGGGEIEARRPSAAEREAFLNNPAALPVCTAAIEHNVCRHPTPVQQASALSGNVWYDIGSTTRVLDPADRPQRGWIVEVVDTRNGSVVGRAITGADGGYRIADLEPGVSLAVRFRDPDSGVVFGYPVNGNNGAGSSGVGCDANTAPARGAASSCIVPGANPQLEVILAPGQELPQQSLPIDPSGVVYDSGLRQPVPGSVVTMSPQGACAGWSPATSVLAATLGGYTISGDSISMRVGKDGLYQFFFTPSAPPSCTFGLTVQPPAGYRFVSTAITPNPSTLLPPGASGSVFNVQPQATPPVVEVGAGTNYHLSFVSGSAGVNIVHNHIPLDPDPPTGVALTKTGDKQVAEVGDSVRYTLTVTLTAGPRPRNVAILDRLPAGFTYIRGTATVNDVPIADPSGNLGPVLAFELGGMPDSRQLVLKYRARVGVGAMQGDGVNTARGHACGTPAPGSCVMPGFAPRLGGTPTNEARFKVRVTGGVFAPEACVLGKIFVDCNRNHIQDKEELGIPGVRFVLSDGTTLVSDSEGKYSICGLPPRSTVMKADPITLPEGSRLTTSSNRNLGDAMSLWLDLKNGELHRADFLEGSCSNRVLDQVKARRAQGEVRSPETEKKGGGVLRFDSKAHGLDDSRSPQQGTDSANQPVPRPRGASNEPRGASSETRGAASAPQGAQNAPR